MEVVEDVRGLIGGIVDFAELTGADEVTFDGMFSGKPIPMGQR